MVIINVKRVLYYFFTEKFTIQLYNSAVEMEIDTQYGEYFLKSYL